MGGTRVRLTRTGVEAAGPGWLWDSEAPGLGVRVAASGVRSYVYRYGAGRRWATRRVTLGRHGEITLELARRLARRLSGAVAEGRDPAHELQQARGAPTLTEAWARYVSEYARLHKRESTQRRDAQDGPWVFPGHRRGAHVSVTGIESAWQRVRRAARLEDVRVHDLRHSFASVLVGRGVSLPVIGGLLGHAKPATTARYAHLADAPLRAAADGAADAISAALRGS